jgi:hypothetical protein
MHASHKILDYVLVPYDHDRKVPKGTPFSPENINGAYTYPSRGKVFVYRYEEFPKVFLHETCHHLSFHTDHWDTVALMKLYQAFSINPQGCPLRCSTDILPNEAVVEAWAEIYHLKFMAHELGVSFGDLLKKEVQHALSQSKKVLEYQKKNYPLWKESTHTFSYVVLRTILLAHWHEFAKLPLPYNTVDVTNFMITKYNEPSFQSHLDAARVRSDSMRMTYFGDF